MASEHRSSTSSTLLGRLRQDPQDQTAWVEFEKRYRPKVYEWARRLGVQDADALDVAQDVLMKLTKEMQSFQYDRSRSFRGWLRTLTHHAWSDYLDKRKRAGRGSATDKVYEMLHKIEARDELAKRIQEEFDLELFEKAEEKVKIQVEPTTWQAYELTTKGGLSNGQAAKSLGIPKARVAVYKSRVEKRIAQVIQQEQHPVSGDHAEDKS